MRAGARSLGIVAVATACLCAPAAASAEVVCSVSAGTLAVSSPKYGETMRVGRSGDLITVIGYNYTEEPFVPSDEPVSTTCAGPTPTVTTVDSITVSGSPSPHDARLILDLEDGPLAPGATAEPDGSSEIEFTLDRIQEVAVRGGDAVDQWSFGVLGPNSAANLNADEPSPDLDVVAPAYDGDGKRLSATDFEAVAGGGNDAIRLDGGVGFSGSATYNSDANGQDGDDRIIGGVRGGALAGGAGADYILGGPKADFLGGGKGDGRDTLIAGGGDDLVFGQGGRDLILGGNGRDLILSGEGRDRVRCGPQRDALEITSGRKDRRKGCERLAHVAFN